MTITQTRRRTLAEPTYGIRPIGDAVRLPAGSLIRVGDPRPELGDTVEAIGCVAGREGEWDEYGDVLVTASALRFHEHNFVGRNEQEA